MREILFRGKRVDNGEWVYGDIIHRRYYKNTDVVVIRTEDSGFDNYSDYEVDPDTVGQYTGLTDKNGKKIFEGDIVKQRGFLNNYYSSVWYAAGRFLVRDYETLLPTALGGISRYEIEVIGNIHDNPELLAMARDPDPPKREPEHKEPTILWTVGNLCMWKGKLCEIERFDTTSNNQTVVHLRREGLGYGLCVPIEELEEKE